MVSPSFDSGDPDVCQRALTDMKAVVLQRIRDGETDSEPIDVGGCDALAAACVKLGLAVSLRSYVQIVQMAMQDADCVYTYDGSVPYGAPEAAALALADRSAVTLFTRSMRHPDAEFEAWLTPKLDAILAAHGIIAETIDLVGQRMREGVGTHGQAHVQRICQTYPVVEWLQTNGRLESFLNRLRYFLMAPDVAALDGRGVTRSEFTDILESGQVEEELGLQGLTVARDWLMVLMVDHDEIIDETWEYFKRQYVNGLWEACEADPDPYEQPGLLMLVDQPPADKDEWQPLVIPQLDERCTSLGIGYEVGARGIGCQIAMTVRQGDVEGTIFAEPTEPGQLDSGDGVFAAVRPFDNITFQVQVVYGGNVDDRVFYAAIILMGLDSDGNTIEIE